MVDSLLLESLSKHREVMNRMKATAHTQRERSLKAAAAVRAAAQAGALSPRTAQPSHCPALALSSPRTAQPNSTTDASPLATNRLRLRPATAAD